MSDIQLWKSNPEVVIRNTDDIQSVVSYAKQLKTTDQKQLISAYESGNFQMLSTYVWAKTITTLKSQLSKMGGAFVGEMLDRPDINDSSNLQQAITDFEAVQLSENLGLISSKSAFRLRHAMDLLTYFNNPDIEELEENDFTKVDAAQVLLACVQGVLGHDRIELRIDFKEFRASLEDVVLSTSSPNVIKLTQSPSFFKGATVRILLSIIKSKTGVQLDNGIANATLILPLIWKEIRQPDKWQIGRCYAELYTEGKSTAVNGLKQILLKVKGFDFVPEDLRSTSFMKAASEIIKAHEGMNNYYYEPQPTKMLKDMGTSIPMPAFPICLSAVLSVKLGNAWGVSWEAQNPADIILGRLKKESWVYYFEECLPNDVRILHKLLQRSPRGRFIDLIKVNQEMEEIIVQVPNPVVKQLLRASQKNAETKIETLAKEILKESGKSR
jgi:hypothetical protein